MNNNQTFTVYILKSKKFDKIYTGYTSNLITRFYSHNKLSKSGYTARFRPWRVIYTEVYNSKREAMKREKWLKSGVGRKFIKNNITKWSSWYSP